MRARQTPRPAPPEPVPGSNLWRRLRVGLLGGSFNPAHEGHLHISRLALKALKLDYVWWLVSPQNPLKPVAGMAPLADRLAAARALAAENPRIVVSDIEARLGTVYTAETLARLTEMFPETRFVWLMGADNLVQIPRWRHWMRIFRTVPVAIFDRPSYSLRAVSGQAARRFARFQLPQHRAGALIRHRPPAWVFIRGRKSPASASALRSVGGGRNEGDEQGSAT